jgi:hypothetical protein
MAERVKPVFRRQSAGSGVADRTATEEEARKAVAAIIAKRLRNEAQHDLIMRDLAVAINEAKDKGVSTTTIGSWIPSPRADKPDGITRDGVHKLLDRHLPGNRRT